MATGHPGFTNNNANGRALLRWWPIILFALIQGASIVVMRAEVSQARDDLRDMREQMVTRSEWTQVMRLRDDQIDGLRQSQSKVELRLQTVERVVR